MTTDLKRWRELATKATERFLCDEPDRSFIAYSNPQRILAVLDFVEAARTAFERGHVTETHDSACMLVLADTPDDVDCTCGSYESASAVGQALAALEGDAT